MPGTGLGSEHVKIRGQGGEGVGFSVLRVWWEMPGEKTSLHNTAGLSRPTLAGSVDTGAAGPSLTFIGVLDVPYAREALHHVTEPVMVEMN